MNSSTRSSAVSLGDVLRLVLPLNTQKRGALVAGRLANWVVVLVQLEQLEEQVQAGDIAILPAAVQEKATSADLNAAITTLAALSVTALLIFRPIDATIERNALSGGLPLLIIPEGATLREIHQGIASLLLNRRQQIVERGMQLYRRLTELSREDRGLVAMTEVMSNLTGKIVAVQDKRLEFMALSMPDSALVDETTVKGILKKPDNLPPLLRNRKAAANTNQSLWQQLLSAGEHEVARLISPIISGDRARGYVSVLGAPEELDQLDTLAAEHGAAACALEMAKAKAVSEAKKSLRGDFLESLLAGKLNAEEVARLASHLDHDTSQRHAVIALAWAGSEPPSLRRLETPLHWILSSHNRPALVHVQAGKQLGIFQALAEHEEELKSAKELVRRLRDHLRAEFPKARLSAGLSGPAITLEQWPQVFRQAVRSMELAQRLEMDSLAEYHRLGIYRLLAELDDTETLREFSEQIIGPLADYDRERRSSLVQTIGAYFEHNGNISQTAEALYIHRNTMLYRLERIQELTGQDIDQPEMRLALHLALRVWESLSAGKRLT